MTDSLHWFSLAVLWVSIICSMIETRRARRARRHYEQNAELWDNTRTQLAAKTGLSVLQVDVALDAANACFNQRIDELVRTARA